MVPPIATAWVVLRGKLIITVIPSKLPIYNGLGSAIRVDTERTPWRKLKLPIDQNNWLKKK